MGTHKVSLNCPFYSNYYYNVSEECSEKEYLNSFISIEKLTQFGLTSIDKYLLDQKLVFIPMSHVIYYDM